MQEWQIKTLQSQNRNDPTSLIRSYVANGTISEILLDFPIAGDHVSEQRSPASTAEAGWRESLDSSISADSIELTSRGNYGHERYDFPINQVDLERQVKTADRDEVLKETIASVARTQTKSEISSRSFHGPQQSESRSGSSTPIRGWEQTLSSKRNWNSPRNGDGEEPPHEIGRKLLDATQDQPNISSRHLGLDKQQRSMRTIPPSSFSQQHIRKLPVSVPTVAELPSLSHAQGPILQSKANVPEPKQISHTETNPVNPTLFTMERPAGQMHVAVTDSVRETSLLRKAKEQQRRSDSFHKYSLERKLEMENPDSGSKATVHAKVHSQFHDSAAHTLHMDDNFCHSADQQSKMVDPIHHKSELQRVQKLVSSSSPSCDEVKSTRINSETGPEMRKLDGDRHVITNTCIAKTTNVNSGSEQDVAAHTSFIHVKLANIEDDLDLATSKPSSGEFAFNGTASEKLDSKVDGHISPPIEKTDAGRKEFVSVQMAQTKMLSTGGIVTREKIFPHLDESLPGQGIYLPSAEGVKGGLRQLGVIFERMATCTDNKRHSNQIETENFEHFLKAKSKPSINKEGQENACLLIQGDSELQQLRSELYRALGTGGKSVIFGIRPNSKLDRGKALHRPRKESESFDVYKELTGLNIANEKPEMMALAKKSSILNSKDLKMVHAASIDRGDLFNVEKLSETDFRSNVLEHKVTALQSQLQVQKETAKRLARTCAFLRDEREKDVIQSLTEKQAVVGAHQVQNITSAHSRKHPVPTKSAARSKAPAESELMRLREKVDDLQRKLSKESIRIMKENELLRLRETIVVLQQKLSHETSRTKQAVLNGQVAGRDLPRQQLACNGSADTKEQSAWLLAMQDQAAFYNGTIDSLRKELESQREHFNQFQNEFGSQAMRQAGADEVKSLKAEIERLQSKAADLERCEALLQRKLDSDSVETHSLRMAAKEYESLLALKISEIAILSATIEDEKQKNRSLSSDLQKNVQSYNALQRTLSTVAAEEMNLSSKLREYEEVISAKSRDLDEALRAKRHVQGKLDSITAQYKELEIALQELHRTQTEDIMSRLAISKDKGTANEVASGIIISQLQEQTAVLENNLRSCRLQIEHVSLRNASMREEQIILERHHQERILGLVNQVESERERYQKSQAEVSRLLLELSSLQSLARQKAEKYADQLSGMKTIQDIEITNSKEAIHSIELKCSELAAARTKADELAENFQVKLIAYEDKCSTLEHLLMQRQHESDEAKKSAERHESTVELLRQEVQARENELSAAHRELSEIRFDLQEHRTLSKRVETRLHDSEFQRQTLERSLLQLSENVSALSIALNDSEEKRKLEKRRLASLEERLALETETRQKAEDFIKETLFSQEKMGGGHTSLQDSSQVELSNVDSDENQSNIEHSAKDHSGYDLGRLPIMLRNQEGNNKASIKARNVSTVTGVVVTSATGQDAMAGPGRSQDGEANAQREHQKSLASLKRRYVDLEHEFVRQQLTLERTRKEKHVHEAELRRQAQDSARARASHEEALAHLSQENARLASEAQRYGLNPGSNSDHHEHQRHNHTLAPELPATARTAPRPGRVAGGGPQPVPPPEPSDAAGAEEPPATSVAAAQDAGAAQREIGVLVGVVQRLLDERATLTAAVPAAAAAAAAGGDRR